MKSGTNLGLIGLTLSIFIATLEPNCATEITCRMHPQNDLDDGWSFDGGFITTDGTLGEISPNDFVKWSIEFTSPIGQYVTDSNNGAALMRITSTESFRSMKVACARSIATGMIRSSMNESGVSLPMVFAGQLAERSN